MLGRDLSELILLLLVCGIVGLKNQIAFKVNGVKAERDIAFLLILFEKFDPITDGL